MTRNLVFAAVISAGIALQLSALPTASFGQTSGALVAGVIMDSATGKPIAEAQITARSAENNSNRTAVSDAGGAFVIVGLESGLYEVIAAKHGFLKASTSINVAGMRTYRIDFWLSAAGADPAREAEPPHPAGESLSSSEPTANPESPPCEKAHAGP